ncbi:MAG: hypothetical protein ACOX1A_09280 [Saccharofermentanales bacterium]
MRSNRIWIGRKKNCTKPDARLSLVNERLEQSGREAADLISHARAQSRKTT